MYDFEIVAQAMIKDGGFFTAKRLVKELGVKSTSAHQLLDRLTTLHHYKYEKRTISGAKAYKLLDPRIMTRRAVFLRAVIFGLPIPENQKINQGESE
jgi:hypothetical protein